MRPTAHCVVTGMCVAALGVACGRKDPGSSSPSSSDDPVPTTTTTTSSCMTIAGSWQDADGDGYGNPDAAASTCDPPYTTWVGNALDCDDLHADAHPEGVEVFGDGIDQDCSGEDWWSTFDDFESGGPDPTVFPTTFGVITPVDADVGGSAFSGRWALALGAGGTLESVVLDTTSCVAPTWGFRARRPPRAVESTTGTLTVEYYDGTAWIPGGTVSLADLSMWAWSSHHGVLLAADALQPAFSLRIRASTDLLPGEVAWMDDAFVACAGDDDDNDDVGSALDCAPADPNHWLDCAVCTDADVDGYGVGCDLGTDCDDANPLRASGLADVDFNGIDEDCNGMDFEFVDAFEQGYSPLWPQHGGGSTSSAESHTGSSSLPLADGDLAGSIDLDASQCGRLAWSVWLLAPKPDPSPDLNQEPYTLTFSWFDGIAGVWKDFETVEARDKTPQWDEHAGELLDPGMRTDDIELRFDDVYTDYDDSFYIDDIRVTCAGLDVDGDGSLAADDCDDLDLAHWWDCQGGCVDGDADDYGAGCDLGEDCNDADGLVNPAAPEVDSDGVDSNCDGSD